MTAALIVSLIVTALAIVASGYRERQWTKERAELIDDIRVANRTTVRTALTRSGIEWDVAEARSAAIDRLATEGPPIKREPDPPMEGFGG